MKQMSIIFSSLFMLMGSSLKSIHQDDTFNLSAVKQAIAESNDLYFQAFVSGDSILFMNRYASDACIMAPHAPALCGQDAAAAFYRMAYGQIGIRGGRFVTQAIYGSGHYVTEQGLYELRDSYQGVIDKGKYLVLWKKTTKGWKMYRDSFSSDKPMLAQK